MNESVAKLTAKWWRNKLECKCHNNGDKSKPSQFAGLFATALATKYSPSKSQLDRFEATLTKLIINNKRDVLFLDCDYEPCSMLYKAAISVGINSCVFPWKTNTRTEMDKVLVKDGYGMPWVTIHESDFK